MVMAKQIVFEIIADSDSTTLKTSVSYTHLPLYHGEEVDIRNYPLKKLRQ